MKSGRLKGAWSSDGTILIKSNDESVRRVISWTDLIPFGYVVVVPGQPVGRPDGSGS